MKESAGNDLVRIFRTHRRQQAEQRVSTASSLRVRAGRWLVIAVSVAGMVAAAASLVLIWTATAGTPLPERINNSMSLGSGLVLLGVAFLVAWRAGDHPPNVSIALAVVFISSHDAFLTLLEELRVNAGIGAPVLALTFILGAGFYIRASQLFPRTLTPDDIACSPTIWGRIKPLRVVLVFFLRARAVWVFVAVATLLTVFVNNRHFSEAIRLVIVLTGLVYFYVMYRSSDAETRRKVLWFLEAALAAFVIGLVGEGVNAVLHGTGSPTLRVVLSVSINAANCLALVICISAAVFYAGAISPALVIRKTFIYGMTAALLLFTYAIVEAFLVNLLVDVTSISDRFASALLGTLFGLAFHPIKNRMEHALRRLSPLARRQI
ncbi:MAG: hypothetical protein AUG81_11315 [Verrucomicrobia bacterium 13_1_20CM_4_54_11]|nr:MAG: hypothetical protein AUG81_11315 [Verrucomicrobia bacterium 13_1_20CM_4_54_11]